MEQYTQHILIGNKPSFALPMALCHEQSLWLLTFSSSGHLTEVTDDERVNVLDPEKLMMLCTMERNS